MNDASLEDTEEFSVTLTGVTSESDVSDQLEFATTITTIEITDDDSLSVGFEDSEYEVTEGEDFEMPVVINAGDTEACPIPFAFQAELTYTDPDGVISSGPESPVTIDFLPCSNRQSVQFETREVANNSRISFELELAPDTDNRIRLGFSRATALVPDHGRFHAEPPEDFGSLDSGNTSPQGIWSDRGTMWVADNDSDKIYAYNLASKLRETGKDFNALSGSGNNDPSGLWSDGTTMWVADQADGMVYAYNMSTKARDETQEFNSLDSDNDSPQGIWSDGATMWISDGEGTDPNIYAYNLDDKQRDDTKDFGTLADAGNIHPRGLWGSGTILWAIEHSSSVPENTRVFTYERSTGLRQEESDNDNLIPVGNEAPRGIWYDGKTMWVSDEADGKVYAYRDVLANPFVLTRSLTTTDTSDDEIDPAKASSVDTGECVAEIVDPDGGRVELGDVIAGRWVSGCPSVTRGGRLAMYYTFDLPITTAAQIALDSHLDDYLVLRLGGLTGTIVEQDDDDGPGNNSLIDRVLTAGRYTIEATTFYADGVEADFTLTVRAVPRVLYDGPVADVASPGYAPVGPTLTVKLLPTQPMGTLEITVRGQPGLWRGSGPPGRDACGGRELGDGGPGGAQDRVGGIRRHHRGGAAVRVLGPSHAGR